MTSAGKLIRRYYPWLTSINSRINSNVVEAPPWTELLMKKHEYWERLACLRSCLLHTLKKDSWLVEGTSGEVEELAFLLRHIGTRSILKYCCFRVSAIADLPTHISRVFLSVLKLYLSEMPDVSVVWPSLLGTKPTCVFVPVLSANPLLVSDHHSVTLDSLPYLSNLIC